MKLTLIQTRFKCYREMQAVNIYMIKDLEEESSEFSDILDIIRKFTESEKEVIFNNMLFNKIEELRRYDEFKQYKDLDDRELLLKFKQCKIHLEKEHRYIKMYLVYMYTVLDECLLELAQKLEIEKKLSGIMLKKKEILKKLNIDDKYNKELFVLNRIRNDFIHNNGLVSSETIKNLQQHKVMSIQELADEFKLYENEKINLDIADLTMYSKICNKFLEEMYEKHMNIN